MTKNLLLQTPGPGTYKISDPTSKFKRSPAFSMQGKHKEIKDKCPPPGPGAYSTEKVRIKTIKVR